MFIKLVDLKKKADEFMFNVLICVHPQIANQHLGRVMRGIRLINWIILVLAFIFVALLFFWFFTSVKLMASESVRESGGITDFDLQWADNDTDYFDLSILASSSSETTTNAKNPVRKSGIIIDPIENVNQTDELQFFSLASTDITAGYLTRSKLHCALKYGTTDETTRHPTLALVQEQQLANNLDASVGSSPCSKVENGASCLAVDLVQEMNAEIEQD